MSFQPVTGSGTVLQYVIVRQTKQSGFEASVPYGAAAVELDEQPQLVVVGNVFGRDVDAVHVGDRVRLEIEPLTADIALPQFRVEPA